MKHPVMFSTLLNHYWITMPKVLAAGIEKGLAGREPKPDWVPLKGLSSISDLSPPQTYANPGFADAYNKEIIKFRRRESFSALFSGISKAELEARLETYAQLTAAFVRLPPLQSQ
jgi:hypothetical protein